MADEPLIKRFLKLQGRFLGYLMAITRDLEAAEEILQDVAVVIMERPPGEPLADFVAWTKEVVRRQALHYLREKGKTRSVDPTLLDGISRAFLEDASDLDRAPRERQVLLDCLRRLPPKSADLIALRYEQRQSFEKIAQSLHSTASAVQKGLSRLRKSLHDCMRLKIRSAEEG